MDLSVLGLDWIWIRSRIIDEFEFEFDFCKINELEFSFFKVNEFEFEFSFFKVNEFEFIFFKVNEFELKKKKNEWIQPWSVLVELALIHNFQHGSYILLDVAKKKKIRYALLSLQTTFNIKCT